MLGCSWRQSCVSDICLYVCFSFPPWPCSDWYPNLRFDFPFSRPPAQHGVTASTTGVTIYSHDCLSLHLNYVKTSGLDLHASWQSVVAQAVEESIRFFWVAQCHENNSWPPFTYNGTVLVLCSSLWVQENSGRRIDLQSRHVKGPVWEIWRDRLAWNGIKKYICMVLVGKIH